MKINLLPIENNAEISVEKHLRSSLLQITAPTLLDVARFGVDHIGYRYFNSDGGSFGFTTNPKWYSSNKTQDFFKHQKSFLEEELCSLFVNEFKYVTRCREFTNNDYLKSLEDRGMSNSLGIYRFSPNKIEHFFFISTANDSSARDKMLNHLSELEGAVNKLKPKISEFFAHANGLPAPEFYLSKKITDFLFNKAVTGHQIPQEILIKGQVFQFTKREIEVFAWLKLASSNKTIAHHLNISPRTTENYIMNLKNKFRCNRASLINLANLEELKNILKGVLHD